ncbi:putative GTPase activating protein [Leptomonas seymouri]|uniref:Putative GTPase activating protein n=1 Tax=Leptomonas seymouri TaxID=5684 RepID=A0A0N1IL31_LEPSE|nr:putative GTPase activating protein [Leptomonas seymouri]|eukprot:KPI87055.1 putative GTPase activating protein [Leptomonas seymouri]
MPNTAAHLQKITGLTEVRAKECFDAFGSYPAALASFAQSYAAIPADYFQDAQVALTHAQNINDELRAIYRKARELKSTSGKSDAEVWKAYSVEEEKPAAAPSASAAPAAFPAKPSDGRSPFSLTSTAASPAPTTGKLGFGLSSATSQPSVLGAAPGKQEPPKFGFGAKPTVLQPSVLGEAPKTAPLTGAPKFGFGCAQPSVLGKAPGSENIFAAPAPASGTPSSTTVFGFGAKSGSPSATAAPAFGFGKAAVAPAAAEATGFVAAAAAETPDVDAAKKPVKYCDPKHFTGPYFDMPRFWAEEVVGRAPLLNLNNGFLEAHKDELRPRLEKWVTKASFYRKPVKYVEIEDEDEEVIRVIIKDADRTFFDPEHRAKMVAFLNAMYHEFHAYGQAMSYLAGLCMLVLTEDETAAVIRFVATEYIKGHWAAEAVGFAMSAWVVEHFMQKLQPEVAKHLEELNFWPDTYLQKILTGLCIHVLQFSELFQFLDAFMAGGIQYLIRFCLAIVEHFRTNLLAIKSSTEANELYELMRLDSRVADREDVLTILARAPSIDLGEDGNNIGPIRSQVYTKRIEPRLKRAPKTETFEPCEVCGKNRPKWWNDDIGAVCDACKNAAPEHTYEKY